MEYTIESSANSPLPQEAMRAIVEAVDTLRGHPEAFVVFRDSPPYETVSVHPTREAAQGRATTGSGLSYIGPFIPRAAASSFLMLDKVTGCTFLEHAGPVRTVVLLDGDGKEVARLPVYTAEGEASGDSVHAVFLTPSGVDKFLMPYLTSVFGAAYAAAQREKWIKD